MSLRTFWLVEREGKEKLVKREKWKDRVCKKNKRELCLIRGRCRMEKLEVVSFCKEELYRTLKPGTEV